MIRTTLVLLLALIGITFGQNFTGDFHKCHSGIFVEYKRIPGTSKIGYFTNEDKNDEHLWSYDLSVTTPFIWDGAFAAFVGNMYFPGQVRFFSFHSVHREGGLSNVFPQTGNRTLGNEYNTNQLIVEDFEKHIDIRPRNIVEPFTAPAEFGMFFGYYKNLQEFHFGMRLETEDVSNGYRRIFWAEGTQFQRYNAGKHRDCPLHNGHVVDSGCDLDEVSNFVPCVGEQTILIGGGNGPVFVGSGNPASVPYVIPEFDEVCSYTITTAFTPVKRVEKEIVIAFTWFGAGSDDKIQITDSEDNVIQTYTFGENGHAVITVPDSEAKITFERKNTTKFENQLVHGFRAAVYLQGEGFDCLELHEECQDDLLRACVVASVHSCGDAWDEVCVAAADICRSKLNSGITLIEDPELYTYPSEEINEEHLEDDDCPKPLRSSVYSNKVTRGGKCGVTARSQATGLTGDMLRHLNNKN